MQVGASVRRSDLRPAAVAVASRFAVFGLVAGSWMARGPEVKAGLGLSDAMWGRAGVATPCGSLIALGASAVAVRRWGPRRVSGRAALGLLLVAPLMTAAPSAVVLTACLLGYGLAVTMLNVPTNSLALQVESGLGRPLMNRFHACYSIGLVAGAGVSAALAALGANPTRQFVITNVLAAGWLLRSGGRLPADGAAHEPQPPAVRRSGPGLLGLLALAAAASETTIAAWCPVYVRQSLHASAAATSLAFGCFAGAMLAGRAAGDLAVHRLGRRRLLVGSGMLVVMGVCLTLAVRGTPAACAGLAVAGLGVAATLPTIVSEAGARARTESSVVALWLCAWPGTALAPPVVGWLSAQTSLRTALLVPVAAGACLAFGSARLLPRTQS